MLFGKLIRAIRKHLTEVSWLSIIALVVLHAGLSWLLLTLVGESKLTNPESFIYYYVVTTSTVGFGDLSPDSYYGKVSRCFSANSVGFSVVWGSIRKTWAVGK